jgi:DNA-binding transcriptional regulator YdaS (Cro superfamily)
MLTIVGSVFTQSFHLAVTRLGNVEALAHLLGVEVSTVDNWLYGSQTPPFK